MIKLIHGDNLLELKNIEDNSVDSVVTDPPYGLNFMGKNWDHGIPGIPYWEEILRVSKPGAFMMAFGGTRTYHRLACTVEDAGWEIRDCLMIEHLFTENWHTGYFLMCRLDFVVTNPEGIPKFGVEFQGGYHDNKEQQIKDIFKLNLMNEIGLEIQYYKSSDLKGC